MVDYHNMKTELPMETISEENNLRNILASNQEVLHLVVPKILLIKYNVETTNNVTWANLLDEVDEVLYPEIKKDIVNIIEQRKKLEWDMTSVPDEYLNEARSCIDMMNQSRFLQDSFVGKGAAGVVFLQNEKIDLCVKYLHDPSKSKNPIHKEFELLDRAFSLDFKKLRIPRAHFLMNNRNPEKSIYSMDHVIGMNVEDLIDSPGTFLKFIDNDRQKLISIIENLETTIDMYVNDISLLHKANIIHADLHIRNVILDKNGYVYLVDFGNSIDMNNPTSEYVNDASLYESLENIKEQDINSIRNIIKMIIKELRGVYNSQNKV